jgi:ribosomal protein L13E
MQDQNFRSRLDKNRFTPQEAEALISSLNEIKSDKPGFSLDDLQAVELKIREAFKLVNERRRSEFDEAYKKLQVQFGVEEKDILMMPVIKPILWD